MSVVEIQEPTETRARRTIGARTGGRSERVVRSVLRAAMDELAKAGYGALRVEDVAIRAGVNKTTIYRRWPTKGDLITAAVVASAIPHEPLPDTGSLRADLIVMLERSLAFVRTAEGRAITRIITVESGDRDVDSLCRSVRDSILTRRAAVLERAQVRGELPVDLDPRVILDAIFVPLHMRVLRYHEDVDTKTIEAFVDLALAGARSRV